MKRTKLPQATLGRRSKPALWRRLLAWLQAKRITSTCAMCSRYSTLPPRVVAMLHSAHLYTDRVEALIRDEAAQTPARPFLRMPTPGDGSPRS